jgi:transposase-like protein
MNKSNKFSPEVRERAVRMVQEHRGEYPSLWLAVESIAPKIGCVPQTLLTWVKRHEIDSGVREGVTTSEAQRVKELEREVKELRRANEILKVASAFFAQAELDRCPRRSRSEPPRRLNREPGVEADAVMVGCG